jgi:hypothetical protein
MNFVFTYAPGTTLEQMVAFETAGQLWASNLTDDVTVNIYVEPTDTLPVGVAGGALMGVQADQSYSAWRSQLAADSKSGTDQSVQQNLPTDSISFTAWVNEITPDGTTSNKLEQTSSTLNVSRANAKALGLTNGQGTALDGYILMNNQLPALGLDWNYSLDGALPANSIDFLSVAVHEIGHILGFYSGVDVSGWQITPIEGFFVDDDDDDDDDGSGGSGSDRDPRTPLRNATGLDMLRFSNEDNIDLVIGGSPFYSIDGGTQKVADYSTGTNRNLGGDGFQASHWKSSGGALGVMEPTIAPGQRKGLRPLDQQALDAIGWDAGTGQANLTTLQNQARAALATRLGVTVAQLQANPGLVQQLTQNRSQDVSVMIDQSQVYEWGWSRKGRSARYWDSIDLPPSAVSSAATTASVASINISDAASSDVMTGWGMGSGTADPLTLGGQNQPVEEAILQSEVQSDSRSAVASSLLSPMMASSTTLMPIDVLSPNYLVGTELLQSAF